MSSSSPVRWGYAFVDRPRAGEARDRAFWAAVTGTEISPARGAHGEFVTFLPPEPYDAVLKHQSLGEGRGGTHLDLGVADVEEFARRASGLGARTEHEEPGLVVLRSPAGLGFCVVHDDGLNVPPPSFGGARLDQVTLDIGPSAYEDEVAFWTGATGWEAEPTDLPEYQRLRTARAFPFRVLAQRLAADRAPGIHIDFATADREAARARHELAGATSVREGAEWHVMRDTAGVEYCLTDRSPEQ
ncbi:VOC family protein [Streptomyces sp. SPB074]|uniref:VOC family protein n=1 Tax=Streptomyces sp. (strain SPB074) TaxID=465543 RepID=UPI00017F224E|nr:VOC family protein [Streptomyces sp. SPB074]EDY44524.1 conserved hypothetical protein [Streptomyces sp. SPB074]